MNKKMKLIFSLMIILGYGLVQIISSVDSSPKKAKKEYLKDQTKMELFNSKDLYANRNFSEEIDRLRTSTFSDIKRKKKVKVSKKNNSKNKQAKLSKKKQKKKAKKKKNKKDKDKKTLQADKKKTENDNPAFDKEPTSLVPSEYTVQNDETLKQENQWIQILSSQPSDENFEAFYSAFQSGELSAENYYNSIKNLSELLNITYQIKLVDLLMRDQSAQAFILLFDFQENKSTAFSTKDKNGIQSHLVSYKNSKDGLLALKAVFKIEAEAKAMVLSAQLLKDASKRDLLTQSSQVRGQVVRGEETASENVDFYIDLFFFLENEEIQDGLAEAKSEVQSLMDFISQNLNLSLSPSQRGSSRT